MNKLLAANFVRLKKDKVFWLGMAFMFAYAIIIIVSSYDIILKTGTKIPLDNHFFAYTMVIGIPFSVFCSLFIGTEYSDGTIRNKLIIGHSRSNIYLSNLIVSVTAGMLMCFSFLLAVTAVGIPLLGFLETDIKTIFLYFLISSIMILSISALFTLLCMLIQNKAFSAVICIIGIFLILMLSSYISSRLNAPEFYDGYIFSGSSSKPINESMQNTDYLFGAKRMIYQFALDFLPTGQGLQITSMSAKNLWQFPLYSFLITITATVSGILCFRKKNLK